MAEPSRQIEVQLGHLCNNRCVFCVSGQLSEQDRAPQLPESPIRRQIEAARADGATKITFLGGEPTIQASFLDFLELAVALDFEEIVLFTNGVMTPRESFRERVNRIIAGLGDRAAERVIWRFSLQGGTREAHDETTVNPGAWDRIIESMAILAGDGARLTGNMCVVSGNHASVPHLAEVAKRYGLENLHLDMFRPRDSGDRTEAYLRDLMVAPYTDMATSFRELVAAVDTQIGSEFDLNIGNLPYCVAPDIAWRIHHDGEDTVTVAASGDGRTQTGFNKYLDKRVDKHKLPACSSCVFDAKCGGVFNLYADIHGHDEFVPVTPDALWKLDTGGHHFTLLATDGSARWAGSSAGRTVGRVDERAGEIDVAVGLPGDAFWRLVVRAVGRKTERVGWSSVRGARIEVALVGTPPGCDAETVATLNEAAAELAASLGDVLPSWELTALSAAATAERSRLLAERARLTEVRKRATSMAVRLQNTTVGGLLLTSTTRSTDGKELALQFEAGGRKLTLRLDLVPAAPATRPRISHSTVGLQADDVARFNAELSALLRGARRARPVASA